MIPGIKTTSKATNLITSAPFLHITSAIVAKSGGSVYVCQQLTKTMTITVHDLSKIKNSCMISMKYIACIGCR